METKGPNKSDIFTIGSTRKPRHNDFWESLTAQKSVQKMNVKCVKSTERKKRGVEKKSQRKKVKGKKDHSVTLFRGTLSCLHEE